MSSRARIPVRYLGLAAIFFLELLLFDRFGSHRVTAIYPRWNDQIQYLSECYTGFEYTRQHGIAAGLWQTLVNPSAQGTLHDFAAVVMFEFVGPSRSAALALNMLALIAWQAALFLAVERRSNSRPLAWLGAMLPLALRGPWLNVPGSAYDFRLDHLAMCALGVTSACALLIARFQSRRYSVIFGAVVGVTLLTRFLTGTYFLLIFIVAAGWVVAGLERRPRFANLGIAAVVAAALAGPIFWLNREWVWNYYYIGHYIGPESAIRNQNFGLGRSIAYVTHWLTERHLGWFIAMAAAAVAIALLILRLGSHRSAPTAQPDPPTEAPIRAPEIFGWGALFLLAPALILILHPQKSEVVLSALAPGVVLLVIAVWFGVGGRTVFRPGANSPFLLGLAGAMVGASVVYFAARQFVAVETPEAMANLRRVNTAADYVFDHSRSLTRPRVSVDYITDAFDAQVLRVICYERHHVWIDFDMRLPTGIAEPDPTLVQQRLTESDFVFLTDGTTAGPYPFDRALVALRPKLRTWCDDHLRAVKQFEYFGRTLTLYQRRDLN